ncbi:hypothetical protein [Brevundimonas naejangsanensis]|uniref:hypothetical protein n=1 Tax=Brevundimonas naejangsanensis TaxID=588932 RepID=UPI003207DF86
MTEREDIVAAVVNAAGGALTGRVRLQKTLYLLDRLGFESEFQYEYYHYGPYSRDLDLAVADAKAFDKIEEDYGFRSSDGARFSIFKAKVDEVPADAFGDLGAEATSELVQRFAGTNVTILELAATVDWLWKMEGVPNWRAEITKRKGAKVQNGRLDKAVELLTELNLPPPPSHA